MDSVAVQRKNSQGNLSFDTAYKRISGRAGFFQRFKLEATNRMSKIKIFSVYTIFENDVKNPEL